MSHGTKRRVAPSFQIVGRGPSAASAAMAARLAAFAPRAALSLGARLRFLVLPPASGAVGASPCGTVLGAGPLRMAVGRCGVGAACGRGRGVGLVL